MKKEKIDAFKTWWNRQRKTGSRVRGEKLSDLTLEKYRYILEDFPDFEINEKTDPKQLLIKLQNYLDNWTTLKGRERIFPQVLYCIRTYLRMYEENINLRPIAKFVRLNLKLGGKEIFPSAKETDKVFVRKALTKEEIREIIKFAEEKNKKIALILQLLYDTGCRVRELANINIEDLHLGENYIHITGKGGYIRDVDFEMSTKPKLKEFIEGRKEGMLFGWKTTTIQIYVKRIVREFAKMKSNQFKEKKLRDETYKKYSKISCHWFRHSRATHLAIVLGDIIKLRRHMGWKSIKMADVYVDSSSRLLRKMRHYNSTDLWED